MEFVIYALLLAAGFAAGFLFGRSKKSDPAPIVVEQMAAPKKRAYVRKVQPTASAAATVNVSKNMPNGKDHDVQAQQ